MDCAEETQRGCGECYTGERNCHGGFAADKMAAVVGGSSDAAGLDLDLDYDVHDVEVLRKLGHCRPGAVADLPVSWARSGHASASVLNFIYVCGGASQGGAAATSSCLSYFTESTEGWNDTEVPDMRVARAEAAAVEAYGEMFVIGGQDAEGRPLSSVEAFDYQSGRWRTEKSMGGGARSQHCAARHLDGIYVVGGVADGVGTVLDSAEVFNLTTRTWSELPSSPATKRRLHSCAMVPVPGSGATTTSSSWLLLVAGGKGEEDGTLATAEAYNLETGLWTEAGEMTTARESFALAVLDGSAVAIGGRSGGGEDLSSAEVYSAEEDSWEEEAELSLDVARSRFAAAAVDYVSGGCGR